MFRLTVGSAIAIAASVASAQADLSGRTSTLRYSYVYGGGGSVFQDIYETSDFDLLPSDVEAASYFGDENGIWAGQPWAAGVSLQIGHEYEVFGPLDDFHRIEYSTSSTASSHHSGIGSATIDSLNPGNHTLFSFTVGATTEFRLAGSLAFVKASNTSHFVLERFDGLVWGVVYTTWSLAGLQGPFDVTAPLAPGDYRLSANVGVRAFGNDADGVTGEFKFDVAQTFAPATALVRRGRLDAGSVADLAASDGSTMRVCKFVVPNQQVAPIEVELETVSEIAAPSTFTYTQTSRMATSGSFSQQIDLYDYAAGDWSTSATRTDAVGTTMTTRQIQVSASAANFVGPGGAMKARYMVRKTGPSAATVWCHEADLASWYAWP
jgi:hypothetical protein